MDIDLSQLNRLLASLLRAAEIAVPIAIDAERGQILRRTRKGIDATGTRFPRWDEYHAQESEDIHGGAKGGNYSPSQEKKREDGGLVTDIKNMEFTGQTLASMGRYNTNELTVSEKYMPIMVGQMKHPKWKYHHNVLGVNVSEDISVMEKAIERMFRDHIR